MTNNPNKTDTHIYNIINNPPKEFTEPCWACGVSEFQLGVRHERERILDALHSERKELDQLLIMAKLEGKAQYIELVEVRIIDVENIIALVEGEPSIYGLVPQDEGEQK